MTERIPYPQILVDSRTEARWRYVGLGTYAEDGSARRLGLDDLLSLGGMHLESAAELDCLTRLRTLDPTTIDDGNLPSSITTGDGSRWCYDVDGLYDQDVPLNPESGPPPLLAITTLMRRGPLSFESDEDAARFRRLTSEPEDKPDKSAFEVMVRREGEFMASRILIVQAVDSADALRIAASQVSDSVSA